MEIFSLDWLSLAGLQSVLSAFDGSALMALIFLATASLVALCVPGVILPMAMTSGALFGTWPAVAIVALGALVGNQAFFMVARRVARNRARRRLGQSLARWEIGFTTYGVWYIIGLRLVGAPQLLVTGGSALTPIGFWAFTAATLVGLLPAIVLAAATGALI
jgi:uncharacterized membrane protein YdjX (TVP38/TMEM64 family)